jgi:hypothetical protein
VDRSADRRKAKCPDWSVTATQRGLQERRTNA